MIEDLTLPEGYSVKSNSADRWELMREGESIRHLYAQSRDGAIRESRIYLNLKS